jgi:hypothetical protein
VGKNPVADGSPSRIDDATGVQANASAQSRAPNGAYRPVSAFWTLMARTTDRVPKGERVVGRGFISRRYIERRCRRCQDFHRNAHRAEYVVRVEVRFDSSRG